MRTLLFIILTGAISLPASALRCGSDIVTRGDHLLEVLEYCGEPALREEFVVRKPVARQQHHLLPDYPVIEPVTVREWTYDFGPNRFMRKIRFEDGVIKKIKTLNKGPR